MPVAATHVTFIRASHREVTVATGSGGRGLAQKLQEGVAWHDGRGLGHEREPQGSERRTDTRVARKQNRGRAQAVTVMTNQAQMWLVFVPRCCGKRINSVQQLLAARSNKRKPPVRQEYVEFDKEKERGRERERDREGERMGMSQHSQSPMSKLPQVWRSPGQQAATVTATVTRQC